MSDDSIAAFVAWPRVAECPQQLAQDAPLALPVAGAFVEQGVAYANQRPRHVMLAWRP